MHYAVGNQMADPVADRGVNQTGETDNTVVAGNAFSAGMEGGGVLVLITMIIYNLGRNAESCVHRVVGSIFPVSYKQA